MSTSRCQLVAVLAGLALAVALPATALSRTPPATKPIIILTVNGNSVRVSEAQLQTLVFRLSPHALRTSTITIAMNGMTHSGTAASYKQFLIQYRRAVAANHARSMLIAVESYNADNTGSATDIDHNSRTAGYAGMTMPLLRANYDPTLSLQTETVPYATRTNYCLEVTIKGQTVHKAGPNAPIESGHCGKNR